MLSIDWRSPAAYKFAKSIPAAGFAWEYLRRDDEYRREFQAIIASRGPDPERPVGKFSFILNGIRVKKIPSQALQAMTVYAIPRCHKTPHTVSSAVDREAGSAIDGERRRKEKYLFSVLYRGR